MSFKFFQIWFLMSTSTATLWGCSRKRLCGNLRLELIENPYIKFESDAPTIEDKKRSAYLLIINKQRLLKTKQEENYPANSIV